MDSLRERLYESYASTHAGSSDTGRPCLLHLTTEAETHQLRGHITTRNPTFVARRGVRM